MFFSILCSCVLNIGINSFNIISKDVNLKATKLIQYLKDKINKNRIVFLQETHSTIDDESKLKDDFQESLF